MEKESSKYYIFLFLLLIPLIFNCMGSEEVINVRTSPIGQRNLNVKTQYRTDEFPFYIDSYFPVSDEVQEAYLGLKQLYKHPRWIKACSRNEIVVSTTRKFSFKECGIVCLDDGTFLHCKYIPGLPESSFFQNKKLSQVAYQEDIHTFSVDVKRFNIKLPAVFLYKNYLLYNTNDRFCIWKPGAREICFPFKARLVRKCGNSLLVLGEDLATIYLVNLYPSPVISKEFRLRSGKVWEDEDWFAGNYKKFLFHPLLLTYKKNIFYVKKDNEGRFKVCKLSIQEDAFKEICLPLGREEVVSLKPVSTTKVLAAVKYRSIKTVDFREGKVFSYPDYPIVYQGENPS
ncbi:hypothetical protein, partial [Desulfurobacterium sp.]|uniref:hypothetical protein n=1 Tax=Desulfurobacterium sp. TaxID=2004706 RepID=UPI00260525AD